MSNSVSSVGEKASGRPAEQEYTMRRKAHWARLALGKVKPGHFARAYRKRLEVVFRHLIPRGSKVLELGCGRGDLLAAVGPEEGVGVDFCEEYIADARERHPALQFLVGDAMEGAFSGKCFDAVVMHDLINDVWDIQRLLCNVHGVCSSETRVVLTFFSRVWQLPLFVARKLGLARPLLPQNWVTYDDAENFLRLAGFEVVRHQVEVLLPLRIPLLNFIFNLLLIRLWPFSLLALSHVVVARRRPTPDRGMSKAPKVSVLVPARNEEGNVEGIFDRMPQFEGGLEVIFVEGNSTDQTWSAAQRAVAVRPHLNIRLMKQPGRGKGDAVRAGFAVATGDILIILDADLTVAPEDLPRFVVALREGTAEFVNGVRLVYAMDDKAMRPLNFVANKFFSLAFTWLLDQPVKDTLCGTKVLWRKDYEKIVANRGYFGDFDPYGDFDLLFGAAKLSLKIVDMPIRYAERTYGETNINRWTGGFLLLNMTLFAAKRLKFV